jgi:hypothetical protein
MEASDIIGEEKTFYKQGVHYRDLDRHLTEADRMFCVGATRSWLRGPWALLPFPVEQSRVTA